MGWSYRGPEDVGVGYGPSSKRNLQKHLSSAALLSTKQETSCPFLSERVEDAMIDFLRQS